MMITTLKTYFAIWSSS